MEIKTTYKGYINGIYGIYCGFKPDGLDIQEEIFVYYPSEGKIFVKDGIEYNSIILKENESIEDYVENGKIKKDIGENING